MNKFVINLNRCSDRLQYYDDSYTRWEAVDGNDLSSDDPIIKKMYSLYNLKDYNEHLGKCGCLLSHKTLWEHIINNKLNNVLIVEDDADQISELPNINDLPKDGITYLGGYFHSINIRNHKLPEIISNDKINKVKSNFRILMTLSYYIPSYDICEKLYSELKKWDKKRYRAIDVMLSKFNIDKYYYYPAIYVERNVESTITKQRKKRSNEYYENIIKPKILIDIGCFNARTGSETYKLLKSKTNKWKGYMIEPNPYLEEDIKNNLSDTDYTYHQIGISDKIGTFDFYLGKYGFYNYRVKKQMNKCMRSSLCYDKSYIKEHLTENKIQIKTETLKSFIIKNKIKQIDLLKIDTEGKDYDIIKNYFDEPLIYPKIIITEDICKGVDEVIQKKIAEEKKQYLISKGYTYEKYDKYNSKFIL